MLLGNIVHFLVCACTPLVVPCLLPACYHELLALPALLACSVSLLPVVVVRCRLSKIISFFILAWDWTGLGKPILLHTIYRFHFSFHALLCVCVYYCHDLILPVMILSDGFLGITTVWYVIPSAIHSFSLVVPMYLLAVFFNH